MLITARSKLGPKVRCLDPNGEINGTVAACDTTEGWVEMYVLRPPSKKPGGLLLVDRKKRELVKIRVHTNFDIVTRRGRKIFQVRWTWSGPPRVMTKQFGPLPK